MSIHFLSLLLFLLLGALFCLTAVNTALRLLQKRESKKQFKLNAKCFFYRFLHRLCLGSDEFEELLFTGIFAQNLVRFAYTLVCILLLLPLGLSDPDPATPLFIIWPFGFLWLLTLFFLGFLLGDHLPRILANHYPEKAVRFGAPIASLFMTLIFPLTYFFFKLSHFFSKTVYFNPLLKPQVEPKQQLIEIIEESDLSAHLDLHDRKLIESVMEFKDRIAREVMVPRVDIFSLPHDMTIEKAALTLNEEGYSRTPVYKNTLDHIIGVLMYKDLLAKYMEYAKKGDLALLQTPIANLVKPVLYAPETKKISILLQEFRKKQLHLAIIVDEYGGTEGIVTIENILEEIVGEIADEYDEEEALFLPLPHGGWIIDARMSILDIEEQLGIEIPQDGDYDTIGGYLFHETGTIPAKGFTILKPHFELEVLRSDDRRVEKVRITPLTTDSSQPD